MLTQKFQRTWGKDMVGGGVWSIPIRQDGVQKNFCVDENMGSAWSALQELWLWYGAPTVLLLSLIYNCRVSDCVLIYCTHYMPNSCPYPVGAFLRPRMVDPIAFLLSYYHPTVVHCRSPLTSPPHKNSRLHRKIGAPSTNGGCGHTHVFIVLNERAV